MHAQCQQITRSCRPTACFKSSSRHPTRIQCQHVSNRQPSPPQPGLPDVTRRHLVPQKTWDKREQQHVQANRREVLSTSALVAAAALFISQPAEAAGGRGMDRYIRRKQLDPLDTYVPVVLAAQEQLQEAGRLMETDAAAARATLRTGAFTGLRDNVRAICEYATNAGDATAKDLSATFFKAIEGYDQSLAASLRTDEAAKPLDVEAAKQQVADAAAALQKVVDTVPAEVLSKAQQMLSVAREAERQAMMGAGQSAEEEKLLRQFLPSS